MKKLSQGFTFVEFIVVFALSVIAVSLAVPSFASLIRNNRIKTQSDNLLSTLSLARSEAIKRSIPVTVCKSSDGASCITDGDFSQGWIVFVDNKATRGTVEDGEKIIHIRGAAHKTLSLTGSGLGSTQIADYLVYGPKGTTTDVGSLTVCDDHEGTHGKIVKVSAMGRNRVIGNIGCS